MTHQVNPNSLLIQNLLREGQSFLDIAAKYDLEVQTHPKFPHLRWFGNQNCSNMHDPLVRQCRGLVLDSNDNWNVVARPLDHIPEWTEVGAPKISWKDPSKNRVLDKIDGRSCYLYYYDGWYVGSNRNVDASEIIPGIGKTLADVFWTTMMDTKSYTTPPRSFSGCTFTWEITGKYLTRVAYKSVEGIGGGNRLTLTGVRLNSSGEETDPSLFASQGIRPYHAAYEDPTVFNNFKQILDAVIDCGLGYSEGVVVVDEKWNRVAVTHPEYNASRQLREQLSLEWLVNNTRARSHTNIYQFAPDWIPLQAMLARSYADLVQRVAKAREDLKSCSSDQAFVEAANRYPFGSVLLKLHFEEVKFITDALREAPWQDLLGWLEVSEEDIKQCRVAA